MGLDNIPREYACKKIGSAVLDEEGRIDCAKTQEQNLCPWKSQLEISGIEQRVVLGMFGTDCWYRGKYAEALVSDFDPPYSFYGKELSMDDSGNVDEGLEPDDCLEFADWVDELADEKSDDLDFSTDVRYIAWWLRFVANNCDGFTVWY